MTISNQTATVYYSGDGVTTQFPVPFKFNDSSHLVVTTVDMTTGAGTVLAAGQYTVTGAGQDEGGAVSYTPALASGYKIVIQRNMPLTQDLDLQREGGLFVENIEAQLDNIVMMVQQVRAELAAAAGDGQITSIVQNVIGPNVSVTDRIATFADTVGNRIKDSGLALADLALVDHTHDSIFTQKQKANDSSVASSTALASDADLQFAMAANTVYIVNARIYIRAPAASGFKVGITGPASPTRVLAVGHEIDEAGNGATSGLAAYGTLRSVTPGTDRQYCLDIRMRISNGVNAGTFALQFAQNVSNASATVFMRGSYLQYKAM